MTWTSGQGEKSEGYTRGNLRSMVDKKMLKMSDINIIWQSGKIPNGPWAVRTALPAELKKNVHRRSCSTCRSRIKDVYDEVEQGSGIGYAPATMELYNDIIELRLAEQRANRSSISAATGRPTSTSVAYRRLSSRAVSRQLRRAATRREHRAASARILVPAGAGRHRRRPSSIPTQHRSPACRGSASISANCSA